MDIEIAEMDSRRFLVVSSGNIGRRSGGRQLEGGPRELEHGKRVFALGVRSTRTIC